MLCSGCRELLESGQDFFRCVQCGKAYLLNNSRFYEGEPGVNDRGEFIFSSGKNIIEISLEEWMNLSQFTDKKEVRQVEDI